MSDDQGGLADLLVSFLVDARAKHRLVELLRIVKHEAQLPRSAFRISAATEELRRTVQELVASNALPLKKLAALVDSVEENGGQHIFLFTLTAAGRAAVTEATAARLFSPAPRQPTATFYSKLPSSARAYHLQQGGPIVVKEVRLAEYWVLDADAARETEDRRTIEFKKERRRAVNLFIADLETGQVQVRIARASDRDDTNLAKSLFHDFRVRLASMVDFHKHLEPVPIWNGFGKIVKAKDETYMSHDEAEDPSVLHRLSNRRARTAGSDVRTHSSYDMDSNKYKRKLLNVFWKIPGGSDPDSYVHTVMSRFRVDTPHPPLDCGKVYVAATVPPERLDYVLNRIRHFAR
jgi:hypothetical protein